MERSQLIAQIKTFIFLGFIRISLHNYMYMNSEREFQYYIVLSLLSNFLFLAFIRYGWHTYWTMTFIQGNIWREKKLVNCPIITIFASNKWDIFSLPLKVISPVHVACCLFSCRSETSKSWLVIVFREKCSERDIK